MAENSKLGILRFVVGFVIKSSRSRSSRQLQSAELRLTRMDACYDELLHNTDVVVRSVTSGGICLKHKERAPMNRLLLVLSLATSADAFVPHRLSSSSPRLVHRAR